MNPETTPPIANTEAPSSPITSVAATPTPATPAWTMTGFFDGLSLDSDDGLPFTWFTKVVKVEPGDHLDIPQPAIAGAVAIAMHKPFTSPIQQGFRAQTAQPTYQMDPDHRLSGVYAFNGAEIAKFNPGDNHNGYTAYFLQQHVYDPSQMSYSQQQQLEAFQIKQASLVPSTLSSEQEEALAARKEDRKAGQYNSAIRQIATYESDKRVDLLNRLLDLKLRLSAGLNEDAIENIRPLRRSAPLIQRLQFKIDEFENRDEPIEGNEDDAPLAA
jgi:hypothetical protein